MGVALGAAIVARYRSFWWARLWVWLLDDPWTGAMEFEFRSVLTSICRSVARAVENYEEEKSPSSMDSLTSISS